MGIQNGRTYQPQKEKGANDIATIYQFIVYGHLGMQKGEKGSQIANKMEDKKEKKSRRGSRYIRVRKRYERERE